MTQKFLRPCGGLLAASVLSGCVYTTSFNHGNESGGEASQTVQESSSVTNGAIESGPKEGEVLSIALDSLVDEDGVGSLSYRWEIEGPSGAWTPLTGEVSSSIRPNQSHVGSRLRVVVRYLDGGGTEEQLVSSPTRPVENVNDLPTNVPVLNGMARQHETLYFDASALRDDDGLGPFEFSWQVSTDQVQWRTLPDETGHLIRLDQTHVGMYLRAVVAYVDGHGTQEMVTIGPSAPVQDVDDPVKGTAVLQGKARQGETLTADVSAVMDEDGIADITVTWEASADGSRWVSVGPSNSNQVQLTQQWVNQLLRARVTVTDRLGNVVEIFSPVSAQVERVNSAPRGVVRIIQ